MGVKLVVFDMDGTLLNAQHQVTPFTAETLALLTRNDIAYTVATGRTLQAALAPLKSLSFKLPHILKNGAVIWCPEAEDYSHRHLLTQQEVWHTLASFTINELTPFVFTLEQDGRHAVYHGPLKNREELRLAQLFEGERNMPLEPIKNMPKDAHVINLSALGSAAAVQAVVDSIADEPHLIAYQGVALQANNLRWIDIHHSQGSKGNAIKTLRRELGSTEIIVFGDGDNDLSMFEIADEAYAVDNADSAVKAAASEVIGHHNEDGVAHFLRQRFNLRA